VNRACAKAVRLTNRDGTPKKLSSIMLPGQSNIRYFPPSSSYGRQPEQLLLLSELREKKPELRLSVPVQGGWPFLALLFSPQMIPFLAPTSAVVTSEVLPTLSD
jgi:hypothetical protein